MKLLQKLLNQKFAAQAAEFMKYICCLVCGFMIFCLILVFAGRQTFFLHTDGGTYPKAIYAEDNHDVSSRSLVISTNDDIHVWTNSNNEINVITHIGICLMYAVNIIPLILAYWFLSRVFRNIQKGQIFTEQNAFYLLYYGVLQFVTAVAVPFIKIFISCIINLISDSRISLSTGQDIIGNAIPSVAFIVAAHIIYYGIHLQDEVDHTI